MSGFYQDMWLHRGVGREGVGCSCRASVAASTGGFVAVHHVKETMDRRPMQSARSGLSASAFTAPVVCIGLPNFDHASGPSRIPSCRCFRFFGHWYVGCRASSATPTDSRAEREREAQGHEVSERDTGQP